MASAQGLGAVPIWFVRWSDLQAAVQDDKLTIGELQSMPSLLIGSATFYEAVQHPGAFRPQGFGNGKILVVAHGTLMDGRSFQFEIREIGKKDGEGESFTRSNRIDLQ